ncbi:hypothetical protein VIBNISFn118_500001 [Vibrio nigripulchritudo SFn118]|nr:hypothetical protein VIBNISFn118_500001 [Vibrio nigripulchritudo SFn118]
MSESHLILAELGILRLLGYTSYLNIQQRQQNAGVLRTG